MTHHGTLIPDYRHIALAVHIDFVHVRLSTVICFVCLYAQKTFSARKPLRTFAFCVRLLVNYSSSLVHSSVCVSLNAHVHRRFQNFKAVPAFGHVWVCLHPITLSLSLVLSLR